MELPFSLEEIEKLPISEQRQILKMLEEQQEKQSLADARGSFMGFTKRIWPDFISGRHHREIAEVFDAVKRGELRRVMIHLAPRHSKSELASWLLPANYLGEFPKRKIIQVSNTAELAEGFGRKVRDTMETPEYQEIYPGVTIKSDSRAAGRWNTSKKGEYYATGVGGAVAGRGADLLIIDDPHDEKQAKAAVHDPKIYDDAFEWYALVRQRLQPKGAIILVMCVAEGQRVLMGDGTWKSIEQIVEGDSVIGYENERAVPKRVLAHKNCGEDDILKITSRSTELRVNARHPVLTVKGGIKTAPLNQTDVIQSRDWNLEWVQAGELKAGDTIVTIKSMEPGKGHRPMAFGGLRQMNSRDYWLLGFMWGDGWIISSEARGDVGYGIARGIHEELNQKVLDTAQYVFGRPMVETEYGYWRSDYANAAAWLRKIGFCAGAKKKRLPDWVFRLRPGDKRQFIMGLVDADGCYGPDRRGKRGKKFHTYTLRLANRNLVDDVRLLARTCGFKTTKIYHQQRTYQPPGSPKPIEAENFSINLTDKNNKIEQKARYRCQDQGGLGLYFRFEDVESIEPDGRCNVYDITVEGAESFVAEGVVVHNTRWSKRDLAGQIKAKAIENDSIDEWTIIDYPAILPSGNALWPQFWPKEELLKVKKDIPPHRWNAQYLQNPTNNEEAIIKRDDWRPWERPQLPHFSYILQSWDTAFTANTTGDYSACTTWGIFFHPDQDGRSVPNVMLINSYRERLEFPALKQQALQQMRDWTPDLTVIERRGSGISLIQELQLAGIYIEEFVPARSAGGPNDKVARANSVSDIWRSGVVWYNTNCPLNEVTIEECADLPKGDNDDLADTATQAIKTLRDRMLIGTQSDLSRLYEEDDQSKPRYRGRIY